MKGGKAGEPARAAPRSPPRPGPRPGESPRTRGQTQSLPGTAAKQAGSAPSRGRQRDRGAAGGGQGEGAAPGQPRGDRPCPDRGRLARACPEVSLSAGCAGHCPRSPRVSPSPAPARCRFLVLHVVLVAERGRLLPHTAAVLLECEFG